MTRAHRMKKLAGLVRQYAEYVSHTSIVFCEAPLNTNNYRKHLNQLKALRGRK